MQLTAYEIALIAGGFTILGVLIGTWLTFRFSLRLADFNAKRLAGMRLREAFAPELAKLQHPEKHGLTTLDINGPTHIPDVLKVNFHKHQVAVNEFRFFLKGNKLKAFNEAWEKYYGYPCIYKPDFHQYTQLDSNKAVERIEAILEFTKD